MRKWMFMNPWIWGVLAVLTLGWFAYWIGRGN
jgi:hypothetical protein